MVQNMPKLWLFFRKSWYRDIFSHQNWKSAFYSSKICGAVFIFQFLLITTIWQILCTEGDANNVWKRWKHKKCCCQRLCSFTSFGTHGLSREHEGRLQNSSPQPAWPFGIPPYIYDEEVYLCKICQDRLSCVYQGFNMHIYISVACGSWMLWMQRIPKISNI